MKKKEFWALSGVAATVFVGAVCAGAANIPAQHEELNKYANGQTEFSCWNTIPDAKGNQRSIWATLKKNDLKVGWQMNAVAGIEAKAISVQGINTARQFCASGTGTMPDGKIVTAAPFLKP